MFSDWRPQWLINSKRRGGISRLAQVCGGCTESLRLQPHLLHMMHIGKQYPQQFASVTTQNRHEFCREKVESQGNFEAVGLSKGNERRRWHGTRRACTLGDKGYTQFCSSKECSLCSIIRNSYKISFSKTNTGWGR